MNDAASEVERSSSIYERARRVLPGGVSYAIRDLHPHPFYVARGAGAHLFDVDGRQYVDCWCGHGALLLGHARPEVVAAVTEQAARGTHYGFAHPLEVRLAELVTEFVPGAARVRFTNSGTEASLYAVRLARAFTGRFVIGKVEGGWHGGYDPLQVAVHAPFTEPESAGLDPRALEHTVVLPFNDLDGACDVIERSRPACVIVEPMLGAAGFIPAERSYLEGLSDACRHVGTLLVFDEVITGFRLARGGAQELFSVTPDLTVLGKVVGGGLPVGALCGRADVFDLLDHRRIGSPGRRVFQGGTFSANPVTAAAGIATLQLLRDRRIYEGLNATGALLRSELSHVFRAAGMAAAITGVGSTCAVHFQQEAPHDARQASRNDVTLAARYHAHLLAQGVAYLPATMPHMFLSAAHTDTDVRAVVAATESFVEAIAGR